MTSSAQKWAICASRGRDGTNDRAAHNRSGRANIFQLSRRVAQIWRQIQLAITTAMHTDSLRPITMDLGNALLSACAESSGGTLIAWPGWAGRCW